MNAIAIIGRVVLQFTATIGRVTMFILEMGKALTPPFYGKIFAGQLLAIGLYSLPVVGMTALFTGAVLALQSYTGFSRFNAESSIASVVVISITRELGPVMAGLMLAGRVGAQIAAEIGTMKVTEQIDALATLNAHPMRYLVMPRIIAALLMTPFLVLIADIIGVFGGYLVSVYKLGFGPHLYLRNTFDMVRASDVGSGLIKAAAFGLIVTCMGCYHGYTSRGGAQGVGRATTDAVVSASVLILIVNYIITGLLF